MANNIFNLIKCNVNNIRFDKKKIILFSLFSVRDINLF